MVTYLDTGGATQNASMILLQIRLSKDVSMAKERLDRSWPFLVGLTNIQQKKPTCTQVRLDSTDIRNRNSHVLCLIIKPNLILCYLCLNSAL